VGSLQKVCEHVKEIDNHHHVPNFASVAIAMVELVLSGHPIPLKEIDDCRAD